MNMVKAKIALYKGKGDITDKLIRWWTKSKYSHVEIVMGQTWTSISPITMRLKSRIINANNDRWDFIDVEIDKQNFDNIISKFYGCKYDWTGIFLSQFLPLGIQNPSRLFCSEFVAMVMKLDVPSSYSPEDISMKFGKTQ